ncbi:MAG: aromatic amino acid lyase, partial [Bacillota bacterium]
AGLLADIALLTSPAAAFNAAVSAGQESPIYRDDTAARQLYLAVQKLQRMVSMTMMTALQAIDLSEDQGMSPVTQMIHDEARKTVSFMENDDMMYERIEAMEELVASHRLLDLTQKKIGDFTL